MADMTPILCTVEDAATELGVTVSGLRSAAEEHGYLVRMGRAIRLERKSLPELIKKCRAKPKAPDSTNSHTASTGTSETPENLIAQQAAQAAAKLKKRSGPTSPQKGGKVLRLDQTK